MGAIARGSSKANWPVPNPNQRGNMETHLSLETGSETHKVPETREALTLTDQLAFMNFASLPSETVVTCCVLRIQASRSQHHEVRKVLDS